MSSREVVSSREEWLQRVASEMRGYARQVASIEIPPVRISVGWPHGKRTIGECWPRKSAADELNQIFISPLLPEIGAIVTLIHELAHAVDDCQSLHGAPFIRIAGAFGLEPAEHGGWTSGSPSVELTTSFIAPLVTEGTTFPAYPHAVLIQHEKVKKQGTRMIKIVCVDAGCGYTLRTTQKWIDVGLPSCACGDLMEVPE